MSAPLSAPDDETLCVMSACDGASESCEVCGPSGSCVLCRACHVAPSWVCGCCAALEAHDRDPQPESLDVFVFQPRKANHPHVLHGHSGDEGHRILDPQQRHRAQDRRYVLAPLDGAEGRNSSHPSGEERLPASACSIDQPDVEVPTFKIFSFAAGLDTIPQGDRKVPRFTNARCIGGWTQRGIDGLD